jgi:tRNA pseudouridine38-40 synthase
VQGVLVEALARVLGSEPSLSVAGRTDAGVHASGQVASFGWADPVDVRRVQRALNGMLAPEVVVREARPAAEGFDARRSATGREYRYLIDSAPVPDPFTARFVWSRPGALAMGHMRQAAALLVGEHDFASFCRTPKPAGASTARHLRRLSISRRGGLMEIRAEANGFLHQMVRSLVGTLVAVGDGRRDPAEVPGIIQARQRAAAAPIAPPQGLCLVRVRYGRTRRDAAHL